jgi:hypothetical protein
VAAAWAVAAETIGASRTNLKKFPIRAPLKGALFIFGGWYYAADPIIPSFKSLRTPKTAENTISWILALRADFQPGSIATPLMRETSEPTGAAR